MCDETHLGEEYHLVVLCKNNQITLIREKLMSKIHIINRQFTQMGSPEICTHLLLAQNTDLTFYYAIFLDKLYKLIDLLRLFIELLLVLS